MLTFNLMGSTLAFPGFLANFGRRENAERETSAHIFMSRNVVVSPPGADLPHPGVHPSRYVRWLKVVWRRDMSPFTVALRHGGKGLAGVHGLYWRYFIFFYTTCV